MSPAKRKDKQLELFAPSLQTSGLVIRESNRAKRLSIQVHAQGRVEVVVPRRTSSRRVRAFVDDHQDWIKRALTSLAEEYPAEEFALPHEIQLDAIDTAFQVRYQNAGRLDVQLSTSEQTLLLRGNVIEDALCRDALKSWLKAQGKRYLIPWLTRVAQDTGLEYQKIQVRGQRTRWGSCSVNGTISLNYGLLFVSPELVRYLLIHELCHTVHLNHSKRFWSLVAKHEPGFEDLDSRLDASWRKVPGWARI